MNEETQTHYFIVLCRSCKVWVATAECNLPKLRECVLNSMRNGEDACFGKSLEDAHSFVVHREIIGFQILPIDSNSTKGRDAEAAADYSK